MELNWNLARGWVAGLGLCVAAATALADTSNTVLLRFKNGETITQQELDSFLALTCGTPAATLLVCRRPCMKWP
jgi:hypothetical protein